MASLLTRTARDTAAQLADLAPARSARPLAPPPPGSGLAPVMGAPGLPLLGHSLGFFHDNLGYARRMRARFGDVLWTDVVGGRYVLAYGPEAIGTVLANHEGAWASEPGWNEVIGPFFRRGVMLMDGEEHRHHRRIMQQAFKRPRLEGYIARANDTIARRIAEWRPGPGFRLYDAAKQLTLDIATEVFMGEELGAEADRLNAAFVDVVVGGQAVVRADVPGGRWHRGLTSRRVLESWFRERIPARRAGGGDDLFAVLCRAESEDGHSFSDDDVVNHMIFTMMAAHDTSTISVAMMGYYLARHPEWQERLRAESLALGEAVGFEDVDRLPGLDLAFRETLRMNAPVGVVARQAVEDTALDGRFVPRGANVLLGIYPTQRMEPWWRDPDVFDPERFSPERAEDKSHPYAWAPFGGGVHKCIGMHFGTMEVKAILHQLLRSRRWSVPDDYEVPIEYGTGPQPADGLPVTLAAR